MIHSIFKHEKHKISEIDEKYKFLKILSCCFVLFVYFV